MARFRKATPVRDHLPGILAGVVSALLVAFIIWAAPAVKGGLSDSEDPPQVESVTPEQGKGLEAQKLGDRLLTARKKFWPVLPVFITVMEALEYAGKLFVWIRKCFC